MSKIPLGLQLYTIRDEMGRDPFATMERVAEIGYAGVEWAGYAGQTPQKMQDKAKALGLKTFGLHVSLEDLETNCEQIIQQANVFDSDYIAMPYLDNSLRNAEGYTKAAQILNKSGAKCKEANITLCYHNHNYEFELIDGITGFDRLMNETDSEFVKFEIDTYWVQYAGLDPTSFFASLDRTSPLVHLKDMSSDSSHTDLPFGEGILNWDTILPAAIKAGAAYWIIEEDNSKIPGLESAAISFKNVQKLGLV